MATTPTPQDVLAVPLAQPNDAGAATIRDYLVALLATLWTEGEGFGGKRPFGNSDWQNDLYRALVKAGYINGVVDEDGCLEEADDEAGDQLVASAIRALSEASAAPAIGDLVVGDAGSNLGFIVGTLVENSFINALGYCAVQQSGPTGLMPYGVHPSTLVLLRAAAEHRERT